MLGDTLEMVQRFPALVRELEAALERAGRAEVPRQSGPSPRAWQFVLFVLGLALGLALG